MFTFIGRRKRGAMLSYFKIFLSFVAIVLAANIALSTSMYVKYERHSVKQVQTYTAEELSQISYSTSFMFEAAKMTLMQLYGNPSVLKLMSQTGMDQLELASLLNQVGVENINLPFLNSIYIYNKRAKQVYYENAAFPVDSFPDQDIISRLEGGDVPNLRPIARRIPATIRYTQPPGEGGESDDVYTFIFYDGSSAPIDNAIILNVSQGWLKNTISAMDPRMSDNTLVVDSTGLVVLGNEQYGYLDTIGNDEGFGDILDQSVPSDYFIRTLEGAKYLITYVSSPILDWKYIKFTPYETVSGKLKQLLAWTLVIFVVVTLLSVLAVMYISKFVYGLFSSKIRELQNKFDHEKNAGFEKKQQFLRMLATRKLEDSLLRKRLTRYGIGFELESGFLAIVFRIDGYSSYSEQYSLEDRALLSYGMMNVMGELTRDYFVNESVDLGDGSLALLLNLNRGDEEELAVKLEELVKNIQAKVAEFLGVSLSASIGEGLEEISEIPGSVVSCKEALEYRLFRGPQSLIYVSGVKELKKKEYAFPESIVSEIIEALLEGNGDSVRSSVDQLIESTRGYSVASLQSTVLRLAFSLKEGMQKYPLLAGEIHYGPFIEIAGRVTRLESLHELIQQLNEQFEGLLEVVARSQKTIKNYERYSDILSQVNAIVERDFADPNLNPEMIAQHFELSAKYLRTLYLKASGESLGEYITRFRLDRAKLLLENEETTVQEAAMNSGFLNINYFYTLFKKYNGITPNEFRSLSSSEQL
ncbi:AraC family transcriptional regulator [Paenibacillus sp. HB172176]|uniref:AraC family transcriptional regulator n=1 Tax=Paenibacillus sp. HB172176 TaxID=2493690 RepID=UPI00143B33F4|nr:AraC family transcriptional regulator [Paenibacillus sp. HB172176]